MNSETIELLAQRYLSSARDEQFVDWAVSCLEADIDSRNIRILASLRGPLYSSEVEGYFKRCLNDLGWSLPNREECLQHYVRSLAQQILSGTIAPVEGLGKIYHVVVALDYPSELIAWLYLDEGQDPEVWGDLEEAELERAIVREARRMIGEDAASMSSKTNDAIQ